MRKYIIYVLITVVLVGVFYMWNTEKSYSPALNGQATTTLNTTSSTTTQTPPTNTVTTPPVNKPPVTSPTQPAGTFTVAQVKEHNSGTSCYSTINGNVYDLTEWINKHPGGKLAILGICGRDGSVVFNMQHGKDEKPPQILAKYKVGIIVE